jgi:hypothetical protein
MRKVFLIGLVVFGAVAMSPTAAVAQQGPVDLDITLGSVTILHYFRNLDVTIDSTALTEMLGYATNPVNEDPADAITISAFPFVDSANLQGTITDPTNDPTAVDLTIQNAWAVRSNNANGTNTVTIAISDGTLAHTSGDTITMSNGRVTVFGGTPGSSVQFPSPGMANPQYGDVILELDLTDATYSGEYVDGEFTLTAASP